MEPILIQGMSGSGKTTSLRTLDPEEGAIITPNFKPLPWKGGDAQWGERKIFCDQLVDVYGAEGVTAKGLATRVYQMAKKGVKNIIIEDFSHYINARIMSIRFLSQNTGGAVFERWNTFAADVYAALFASVTKVNAELPQAADSKLIVMAHTEPDEMGRIRFRTAGKQLKDKIDPVSYFRILLHSRIMPDKPLKERYVFQTQDDGKYECKSPMEMFPAEFIPNDMQATLDMIRAYDNEEKPKIDESKEEVHGTIS